MMDTRYAPASQSIIACEKDVSCDRINIQQSMITDAIQAPAFVSIVTSEKYSMIVMREMIAIVTENSKTLARLILSSLSLCTIP